MNVGGWFIKLFEIETPYSFWSSSAVSTRVELALAQPEHREGDLPTYSCSAHRAPRAAQRTCRAYPYPLPQLSLLLRLPLRQTAARVDGGRPRWIALAFKIGDPQQQPEGKMRRQRSSLRKGWPFPSRACGSVTLRGQSRTHGLSRVCVPVLHRPIVCGPRRARERHELFRWGAQWKVAACSRARP